MNVCISYVYIKTYMYTYMYREGIFDYYISPPMPGQVYRLLLLHALDCISFLSVLHPCTIHLAKHQKLLLPMIRGT